MIPNRRRSHSVHACPKEYAGRPSPRTQDEKTVPLDASKRCHRSLHLEPDRTGPQSLESRRRVKIGTLSSCKMDIRIGFRVIPRPLRCDRNSTILVEILASIPRARKSLHRQVKGVHESVLGPTPRLTIRRLLTFHKPTGSQQRGVRRVKRRNNDSDGSTWPTR